MIVSSIGIFVNNDPTSCDISSSLSCKGGIEDNILENFCVSLMEYSFLHKSLKKSDINFATLYVNVPV